MSLLARGVQSLSRNISRSAGNVKAPSLAAFYHKKVSDSYRKSALRGVVFPCVCVGGLATHVACRCVWTICSMCKSLQKHVSTTTVYLHFHHVVELGCYQK